jgi:hypothetical protein
VFEVRDDESVALAAVFLVGNVPAFAASVDCHFPVVREPSPFGVGSGYCMPSESGLQHESVTAFEEVVDFWLGRRPTCTSNLPSVDNLYSHQHNALDPAWVAPDCIKVRPSQFPRHLTPFHRAQIRVFLLVCKRRRFWLTPDIRRLIASYIIIVVV